MIIIKLVPNFAKYAGREKWEFPYKNGKTVNEYINGIGKELDNPKIIVSGKEIKDLSFIPDDGDEIIITNIIGEPITFTFFSYTITVFFFTAEAITLAVIIAAFAIYSYATRPKAPDTNLGGSGMDEGSATYGWEGARITQDVGTPVGVIYGEHRVAGNIINQFIWTDGDKNYLNILIALCEGEIESISEIKANDNPVANFDGITQYTRMGTNSQTLIENFEDLHNVYTVSATLAKDNAYTYTTVDSDVEAFELKLYFPNGLYQQSASSGSTNAWAITYNVQYKLHADPTYTDLGDTTVSIKSRTALRRVFRKEGLTAGQYDIKITKTSDDSDFYHTGDLILSEVDEMQTDDLIYPNTALLGLKLLATDQLSGSTPNITSLVKGEKVNIPNIKTVGGTDVDWDDYYWNDTNEKWKLLSDDTELAWDGTTYVDAYSANPVWCFRDLLVNDRYGLGQFVSTTNLDAAQLLEMAKYCEERLEDGAGSYEKRFRMDVVIDSNTRAIDTLLQLSAVFNAMPLYSGGALGVVIDKPTSSTQLFGMGNIIKDTFNQSWKSIKEIPNVIEVQFCDKDKDYKMETVAYTDDAALAAGDPVRKQQLRLFTTKTSYAIRAARYAMKIAKYVNRSISFKAGIEAIACQAGDVISMSHDIPQWGFSGKVQASSTTTLVKLDRTVTIVGGTTYKIQVRFADDTIEERTITDGAGDYTEVNVSVAFSNAPEAYDNYAFGESTKVVKDFRVVSIKKEGKDEVSVIAAEYNTSVYDDTDVTIPTNNYSALLRTVPPVENLSLTERLVIGEGGDLNTTLDVWWEKPSGLTHYLKQYAKARVYLSDDAGESWSFVRECYGTSAEGIHIADVGSTYYVAVTSVSSDGEESALGTAPQSSLTVLGKMVLPSDVTGCAVNYVNNSILMTWTEVTDLDLKGYEIRVSSLTGSWSGSSVVATNITGSSYTINSFVRGTYTYYIKAIDTSGNYSDNPCYDTITITNVPAENIVIRLNEWTRLPVFRGHKDEGALSDMALNMNNLYNEDYHRLVMEPESSQNWSVLDALSKTCAQMEGELLDQIIATEATYTTDPWEITDSSILGTLFSFSSVIQEGVGATIIIQYSTSDDLITWSDWQTFTTASVTTRYVKFKFKITAESSSKYVRITDFEAVMDVPDITDEGKDVAIGVGGTVVSFNVTFSISPRTVVSTVTGASASKVAVITLITKTSFKATVYDKDNNSVADSINWFAKGAGGLIT